MKASDRIASCPSCLNYAKFIDPNNWDELYNSTWLQIREKELRDPMFHVDHYKTFFQSALKNTKRNQIKSESRRGRRFVVTDVLIETVDLNPDLNDVWEMEITILHRWLNEPPEDQYDQFLKNIITLRLKCKTIKRAAEFTEMSETCFKKYLKEAHKELDYAYFLSTDRHPLSVRDLVQLL